MKCITFLWAATAASLASGSTISSRTTSEQTLRLMSYNFRYDSQTDTITVQQTINGLPKGLPETPSTFYASTTEKPWSTRRIGIANDILFPKTDILGVQEALKRQIDDLQILLGDGWAWVGVGRDDGKEAGEYEAIFYQKSAARLVTWDTFWLSDTPFEPSKYPGAGSFRSCTVARFRSANGGGVFTLMNTHLDDQSDAQRKLGASLILHRAKYEAIKTGRPVFVTGDFNSAATGANDGAYKIAIGAQTPLPLNETFTQKYSWSAKDEGKIGNFTLDDVLVATPPERRSGILQLSRDSGSNGGWTAESYHRGDALYDDGVYHSDHRPVYTDLTIRE